MDSFHYQDEQLYCERTAVRDVVDVVGTPTYLYSSETFAGHFERFRKAFAEFDPLICYSVKACGNIHVLRLLAERGSGFDVVSGGELYRVVQAGGEAAKVVFAGVGKSDAELREAIEAGIAFFNIESEAELENLIVLAQEAGKEVHGALRVNPDVDPQTHKHTTTGKKGTKFGVDLERVREVFAQYGKNSWVRLSCIHIHIGSPVDQVGPYVQAIGKTLELIDALREEGFGIESFIIGGGFGADYTTGQAPAARAYAEAIAPLLRGQGLRLVLEPGRSIAGNAGILLTRVLYVKRAGEKTMVIVDAAMNDLIRPALYDAYHFIWPVGVPGRFSIESRHEPMEMPGLETVDVVGPICESGDYLAKARALPPLARGDLLAVYTTGAYGFVMSSQYNARPRAAEVLVEGANFRTIRRRESYQDLIDLEQ